MPAYRVFKIECDEGVRELLIAFLSEGNFEAFVETEEGMEAYLESDRSEEGVKVIDELRKRYDLTYTIVDLEDKNWNEVWESQFSPIAIDKELLLRASFHPARPEMKREIVIDPRMAFGTGHHATTYLMCERVLEYFAERGETKIDVLDYGTGTGVLAILAKQLGAGRVDAVDIERPAYENTLENATANGVVLDRVVHGTLAEVLDGKPYDLVLANINRNVLLETAPALYARLRSGGGVAYLSGILAPDAAQIIERMNSVGLRHLKTYEREDWRCFAFLRD